MGRTGRAEIDGLGKDCNKAGGDTCKQANAECDKKDGASKDTCECKATFFQDGDTCKTKVDAACTKSEDCTGDGQECKDSKCKCKDTHTEKDKKCEAKAETEVDAACTKSEDCTGDGQECKDSKCKCKDTHT